MVAFFFDAVAPDEDVVDVDDDAKDGVSVVRNSVIAIAANKSGFSASGSCFGDDDDDDAEDVKDGTG